MKGALSVKRLFLSDNNEKKNKNSIGTAVAVAVTSSVAFAALSIAVLTAVYCKSLLEIEYLGDSDVYDE